jgi:hypothetical protein
LWLKTACCRRNSDTVGVAEKSVVGSKDPTLRTTNRIGPKTPTRRTMEGPGVVISREVTKDTKGSVAPASNAWENRARQGNVGDSRPYVDGGSSDPPSSNGLKTGHLVRIDLETEQQQQIDAGAFDAAER